MTFLRRHWAIIVAGVIVLISVVYVIGTYVFVFTISKRLEESAEITLPPVSPAGSPAKRKELILEVDADGGPSIKGASVVLSEVGPRMEAEGVERLILRVSKKARYEKLKIMLEELGRQGVANVTLAVVDEDKMLSNASAATNQ